MERLLLVRCSGLVEEDEGGQALRTLVEVVRTLEAYCPWVEPVRPGICTLPARGPARYFGGESALVEELTGALDRLTLEVDLGRTSIGIAEGLFGAELAAGAGTIVTPGETPDFLAGWPVAVLDRPELTDLFERLGLRTLGDLAALPSRHVLARFGGEGVLCHRVARGEEGELFGRRTPGLGRRLRELSPAGRGAPAERQPGFWGGLDDQGRRAAQALAGVGELLGPEAVLTARLQGGRSPLDRVRLVPWDPSADPRPLGARATEVGGQPWPGRLPPPFPAALFRSPVPAEVGGPDGTGVRVSGRGALSAAPVRLSIDGGPWTAILGWAGPWPVMERWWTRSGRRLARLQLITEDGRAHLLAAEGEVWRLEATYA